MLGIDADRGFEFRASTRLITEAQERTSSEHTRARIVWRLLDRDPIVLQPLLETTQAAQRPGEVLACLKVVRLQLQRLLETCDRAIRIAA